MQVQLIDEGAGRLRLRFTNDTEAEQWLAKDRAFLDGHTPLSRVLVGEPHAAWRGPVAKRLPYNVDELTSVAPGESVESDSFQVSDWLRFEQTGGEVHYEGGHPWSGVHQGSGPFLPRVISNSIKA